MELASSDWRGCTDRNPRSIPAQEVDDNFPRTSVHISDEGSSSVERERTATSQLTNTGSKCNLRNCIANLGNILETVNPILETVYLILETI